VAKARSGRWLALATVLVAVGGCHSSPAPVESHNVILISIDTLRPDHLSCYGYERDTSPQIDRFRRDAILFERAIAHAPSTLSSHASILTSALPQHHRASHALKTALSAEFVTLAERLKEQGYETASFNGGAQLAPVYGLNRGFDVYESARGEPASADVMREDIDRFSHVVGEAIGWMEARRDRSFFLFLHSYEVHHPYTPDDRYLRLFEEKNRGLLPRHISVRLLERLNRGGKLDSRDLEHIVNTYDAEIRSVDDAFGTLIDYLKRAGSYDRTLIVLTSDHGEEFGEHGRVGWHSHTLFDELLKVPLIIKLPDSRQGGDTVWQLVRSIDIAPTILAALDAPIPETFDGTNLLEMLRAEPHEPLVAISERDHPRDRSVSIHTGSWKLYDGELYDLEHDPTERKPVTGSHADVAASLRSRLEHVIAAREPGTAVEVQPDRKTLERLRALGYVD
jgi:arylsulfatase A-like enzyme